MKEQKQIEEERAARKLLNELYGEKSKPWTDLHGMSIEDVIEKINEGSIISRWQTETEETLHMREDVKNLADAPVCHRAGCYNCVEGKCVALEDNNFGSRECPFFVVSSQVKETQKRCLIRLLDEGREDLIERYGEQLAEMGIVALGDTGLEQMFTGLSTIEMDLAKKAERAREKRKNIDPDFCDDDHDAGLPWKEDVKRIRVDRNREYSDGDDPFVASEEDLFGR